MKILQFDIRDKKPTVWNIAILTAAAAILLSVLWSRETTSFREVGIVLCLYFLITVLLLIRAFVRQIQYNPYSYNSIYYSGFALFLGTELGSQISILRYNWNVPEIGTEDLGYLAYMLLTSARRYMTLSLPFIVFFAAGLCLSNISLIRHEGKRLVNLLGILLSFLMIGGELFLFFSTQYTFEEWDKHILHMTLTNLFAAFYLYFECMLIGTILANLIVLSYKPARDKDYLIILGCGLRKDGTPTPLLAGRIDRAIDFCRQQVAEGGKALLFVASGGQGPGEVISECASIKAYLMDKGIPEDQILGEDRSENTYENMLFSKALIERREGEGKTGKVAYSTTNYHVFRSGLMARRVKMRAVGIGSRTKWYFWPNATVREFVGILTEHRFKQAVILGSIVLLYSNATLLYYYP